MVDGFTRRKVCRKVGIKLVFCRKVDPSLMQNAVAKFVAKLESKV